MRKIVESVFCDIDNARNNTLVQATHEDYEIIPGRKIDVCEGCIELIHKLMGQLIDELTTPVRALEATPETPETPVADTTQLVEGTPETPETPDMPVAETKQLVEGTPAWFAAFPQEGTPEWFTALRAYADAHEIRYMYGDPPKAVYGKRLKREFSENLAKLKELASKG